MTRTPKLRRFLNTLRGTTDRGATRRSSSRRALMCQSLETRQVLAGGGVFDGQLKVRFEYVDSSGAAQASLQVGRDYTLRTFVQDIRTVPTGVRNAYLTIDYNSVISVTGAVQPGTDFNLSASGDVTSSSGRIVEAGGIDTNITPPNPAGSESLLFSVPIRAVASGTLDLNMVTQATNVGRRPLFFNAATAVPLSEIDLDCDVIEILSAGVQLSRTSGLSVNESGTSDTFTAVLTQQPSSDVTFSVTSSLVTEATVSPTSVTFTRDNWNVPRTITVTGVNDLVDDGDRVFSIMTGNAASSDQQFDGLVIADITGTTIDNDTAGITLSRTSGLQTTEAGGQATFTVRLDSQPTAQVTIPIRSNNTNEATVSPASIVFTQANWNAPQTVTATGVNDDVTDGDIAFQIITDPAQSTDSIYNTLNVSDVSGTNTDNDVRGFTVVPPTDATTNESGKTATFTIRLNTQPTGEVRIPLSVSIPGEASLSTPELTFTASNWNLPQTVTVTGLNEDVVDGNVPYQIVTAPAISAMDSGYNGLNPNDISLTNLDNDVAGIIVNAAPNLRTTEAGGTATFNVVLTSRPTRSVAIGLTSGLTTEGTITQPNLTFTPENWNAPQTVIVQGVDDLLVDGDRTYSIQTANAVSEDPNYNNRSVADVTIVNEDNDVAGVTVTAAPNLRTTEANSGTATFTVVLNTQPSQNVTVDLTSSDITEGTVSSPRLTFTTANWNIPQTVTVTGVDDAIADGNVTYSIITSATSSADQAFSNLTVADVSLTNVDNDSAAILVDPIAGLQTSEAGLTALVRITLSSQPTANVTIPIRSSDTTEGTVSQSSLTFTPQNWNVAQTTTVTGVDDFIDDGDIVYTIITDPATSTDTTYNGLNALDAMVTNLNDDDAGIVVAPVSGLETSEFGDDAIFTIVLESQPTSPVTIGLTSSNLTEGTVDRTSVTFDATNWNVPQTVTVTGVDDLVNDGSVVYSIQTVPAVSMDVTYTGLDSSDVGVTNLDDDVRGVAVIPTRGLVVSEDRTTATFEVVLTAQPTADVRVGLTSSNPDEAMFELPGDATGLVFTPANWNVRQIVTVRGVDDAIVDGTKPFTIQTAPTVSTDLSFNAIDPSDVTGTVTDNDSATLMVNAVSIAEGSGTGTTTMQFTVTLSAAIESPFSVIIAATAGTATSDDFVAGTATLNFAGTANETKTFDVQINRDSIVEPAETLLVSLSNLSGVAPSLAGRISLPTLPNSGTITNDDTTTVRIVGPSATNEGNSGDTPLVFTVTSTSAVQGGFSIAYSSADGTATLADSDYVQNDGTLTFVGTAGESKTITVLGRGDERVESDETLRLNLGAISGVNAGLTPSIVVDPNFATATLTNDDFPTLTLTSITTSFLEGSGGGATEFRYEVRLSDAVVDPDGFSVPFSIVDGTATSATNDYVANSGTLQFSGTAGEVKSIVVQVNADSVFEGNETFSVVLGAITGLAAGQTVRVVDDRLTTTIQDDDQARLTLSTTSASATEGGQFQITATLSDAVPGGLTVEVATQDGTAASANSDFTAVMQTLTFNGTAGETKSFVVASTQDNTVEGNESLSVLLRNLSGDLATRVLIGNPLALTITNDDSSTLTITGPAPTAEGNGSGNNEFVFTATLSNPVGNDFSVAISAADGTARVVDGDYLATASTLAFPAGTTTQTIRVPVTRDGRVEPDETFLVALGALSGLPIELVDSISVSPAPVVASIINDDFATIGFTSSSLDVFEATGTITVPVRLSVNGGGSIIEPVTVNVVVRGTSTASSADYVLATTSVTFAAGSLDGATQNVMLTLTQDGVSEDAETIALGLELESGGSSAVTLGSIATQTINVTDDARNAILSGRVWLDANNDGLLTIGEATLGSVPIRLTGRTTSGETVNQQVMTDANGFYIFTNLSVGTYAISQLHPSGYVDGKDVLGTMNGRATGTVTNDRFSAIEVRSGEIGTNFNFGEQGMTAATVTQTRILARPNGSSAIGPRITQAMLNAAAVDELMRIRG